MGRVIKVFEDVTGTISECVGDAVLVNYDGPTFRWEDIRDFSSYPICGDRIRFRRQLLNTPGGSRIHVSWFEKVPA